MVRLFLCYLRVCASFGSVVNLVFGCLGFLFRFVLYFVWFVVSFGWGFSLVWFCGVFGFVVPYVFCFLRFCGVFGFVI